jgi:hypothetical protein
MTAVHYIQQAVDDIRGAKLCEVNSMSSRREMIRLMDCALAALHTAQAHLEQPRRLTDDQIGRLWFEAKIPGLNEADARRLIRAVEAAWQK